MTGGDDLWNTSNLLASVKEENCNILPGVSKHCFMKIFVGIFLSFMFIRNQQVSFDLVIA